MKQNVINELKVSEDVYHEIVTNGGKIILLNIRFLFFKHIIFMDLILPTELLKK